MEVRPTLLQRILRSAWVRWSLRAIIILIVLVCLGELLIKRSVSDRIYDNPALIPHHRVGLVFGTAFGSRGGGPNHYFVNRMKAAARLYQTGKVDHLLLSGDNRHHTYNEPVAMRNALIKMGVDSNAITLDHAGLSTYDSVLRAKKVFGLAELTCISQLFQNERALYIAQANGIDAVGFNAAPAKEYGGVYTWIRERGARVKMWFELLTSKDPKHLGEQVMIGDEQAL